MRRSTWFALLAGTLMITPTQTHAQEFAGPWTVEYGEWRSEGAMQIRMQASSVRSSELTITVTGDSAVVTIESSYEGGRTRTDTLRGTVSGNSLKAVGTRSLTMRSSSDGAETSSSGQTDSTLELEVTLNADALEGVLRIGIPAIGASTVADITGRRRT